MTTTPEPIPDLLRRAAQACRDIGSREEYGWRLSPDNPHLITDGPVLPVATTYTAEDAPAIAQMRPAVALALADFLSEVGRAYDGDGDIDGATILRLARTILREDQ